MSTYKQSLTGKSALETYKNNKLEVEIFKNNGALSLLFDLVSKPQAISSTLLGDKDVNLLEHAGFIELTVNSIQLSSKGAQFLGLLNISKQDVSNKQQAATIQRERKVKIGTPPISDNPMVHFSSTSKARSLEEMPHRAFMEYMAKEPYNDQLWREFQNRYQNYIARNIYRTCRIFNYKDGLSHLGDIEQEVYTRLLEKNRIRLKNFAGKTEYSIFLFLAIVSTRVVLNHISATDAKRRIPLNKRTPLDTLKKSLALKDILPDDEGVCLLEYENLIHKALNQALADKPFQERNRLIFEKYFFEGLAPSQIAELPEINIQAKSVSNIVSKLKKSVKSNFIDLMFGTVKHQKRKYDKPFFGTVAWQTLNIPLNNKYLKKLSSNYSGAIQDKAIVSLNPDKTRDSVLKFE